MDGNTLQQLFSGTNPFLAQMGEKAFNLDQQKKQSDLASIVGAESRANQMLPLDMDAKRANIRQSDAAAGYSTSMKNQLDDNLSVLKQVPMDQRVATHIGKMKSELSGDQLKQTDAEMETLLGAAAAAAKNRGTLPLGYTLQNPKHAEYFKTPQGSALAMQIAKSYFMQKPKEMYAVSNDERDAAKAAMVANIGAKAATSRGGAGGSKLKPPKNNLEAVYYYQELARQAGDETASANFAQMAQAAQQAYEQELYQKATLAAQTRLAGGVDVGQLGDVPTRPMPSVPQGRSPTAPAAKPKGDGSKDNPIILK